MWIQSKRQVVFIVAQLNVVERVVLFDELIFKERGFFFVDCDYCFYLAEFVSKLADKSPILSM